MNNDATGGVIQSSLFCWCSCIGLGSLRSYEDVIPSIFRRSLVAVSAEVCAGAANPSSKMEALESSDDLGENEGGIGSADGSGEFWNADHANLPGFFTAGCGCACCAFFCFCLFFLPFLPCDGGACCTELWCVGALLEEWLASTICGVNICGAIASPGDPPPWYPFAGC